MYVYVYIDNLSNYSETHGILVNVHLSVNWLVVNIHVTNFCCFCYV